MKKAKKIGPVTPGIASLVCTTLGVVKCGPDEGREGFSEHSWEAERIMELFRSTQGKPSIWLKFIENNPK